MFRRDFPVLLSPRGRPVFPEPELADATGLLAVGGSLEPEWLLAAYANGIFPWFDLGLPPLWWSPQPRAVIDGASLHVSHSMKRLFARGAFEVSFDRDFRGVMEACAQGRQEGTWITPEMLAAYTRLHHKGHAHSFEVWQDGQLVGGLYGVHLGALFAAESMFHRVTNASKIALITAVRSLFAQGIEVFDVQFLTGHLESMGAFEMMRSDYVEQVRAAVKRPVSVQGLVGSPLTWC